MIVLIATAWSAAQGGVNAFNFELGRALARTGHRVLCAVTDLDAAARARARTDGIDLIVLPGDADRKPVPADAAMILDAIRAAGHADNVELWIGHDLVSGETAAAAAELHGGKLALIHHMDYLSYQNFGGDRGDDTARNNKRQIALFSTPRALLFGVGSQLRDNAKRLGGREASLLIPGFPLTPEQDVRGGVTELRVVAAGRFDARTEPLKRMGTAVRGFAHAVRRAQDILPNLAAPIMTIVGVEDPAVQASLHQEAAGIVGRPLNIVPAAFDPDPTAVATLASRAHLMIVPSRHEGFSLVGWEAIGTATPLVIGRGAGLATLLTDTFHGEADGLLHVLPLDGTAEDEQRIATAVIKVAGNVSEAMTRARLLRKRLATELNCTWQEAAEQLLVATGLVRASDTPIIPDADRASNGAMNFLDDVNDYFRQCAELGISAAQGSSRQSIELIVELRFGVTAFAHDGIKADFALKRAVVEVKPREAKLLRGDRLGEGSRTVPGIAARAGGSWIVDADGGGDGLLLGRKLGTESLCMIKPSSAAAVSVDVEVTAARSDIACHVTSARGRLSTATEKVMAVFLKEAIWKKESDHVVFSKGCLTEERDDR